MRIGRISFDDKEAKVEVSKVGLEQKEKESFYSALQNYVEYVKHNGVVARASRRKANMYFECSGRVQADAPRFWMAVCDDLNCGVRMGGIDVSADIQTTVTGLLCPSQLNAPSSAGGLKGDSPLVPKDIPDADKLVGIEKVNLRFQDQFKKTDKDKTIMSNAILGLQSKQWQKAGRSLSKLFLDGKCFG